MSTRVHIVEVGGRGGVYHHAIAVAESLVDAGCDVVLHTAADAEELDADVPRCPCMRWSRRPPNGIRQPITAVRFLTSTVRHLRSTVAPGDLVNIQGQFGPLLTEWMMRRLVARGNPVVWSPHNTFARSGHKRHEASLQRMAAMADVCIAFSASDAERLDQMGADVARADLIHHLPVPSGDLVQAWRDTFGPSPVALLAGQVRADKQPDVFLRACELAGVNPALVGTELDGTDLVERTSRELGVEPTWIRGYVPLAEFTAALCAADVVVASHQVGSISGPLAMARELGVRTVAAVVGGLAEHVTVASPTTEAAAFATAIRRALELPRPAPERFHDGARQHLDAFAVAGWVPAP